MYCEKCGKQIDENNVCKECDIQLEESEKVLENESDNAPDALTNTVNAYNEPVEDCVYENKLRERFKARKKRRVGAHICASILSLFLFLIAVLTLAVGLIRNIVSPETIQQMISNISLSEIKIEDITQKEVLQEYGFTCDSDNLMDIIYDNIDQSELPQPISKEEFAQIVENENFQEFFGDVLSESINAFTSGNESQIITADDLVDYLADNKEEISGILGYDLTDERLDNLRITINEKYGKVFEKISVKELDVAIGAAPAAAINIVFSNWLFAVLIVINLILVALVFLVVRSLSLGTKYCGATTVLVGLVYLCVALAVLYGALSSLPEGPIVYVVNQLASVALWKAVSISLIMIFVGISIPVAIMIINRYKNAMLYNYMSTIH